MLLNIEQGPPEEHCFKVYHRNNNMVGCLHVKEFSYIKVWCVVNPISDWLRDGSANYVGKYFPNLSRPSFFAENAARCISAPFCPAMNLNARIEPFAGCLSQTHTHTRIHTHRRTHTQAHKHQYTQTQRVKHVHNKRIYIQYVANINAGVQTDEK